MLVFNLNHKDDRTHFAQILAEFQGYGVEYRLSYEPSEGTVYVTPTGARK